MEQKIDNSKFKRGSGCFKCEICKKLTRDTGQDNAGIYCKSCEDEMYHENEHNDGNYENDDCGNPNCKFKREEE